MNELTELYEIFHWAKIVANHAKGPIFFTSEKQTREEIDAYKKFYKTMHKPDNSSKNHSS